MFQVSTRTADDSCFGGGISPPALNADHAMSPIQPAKPPRISLLVRQGARRPQAIKKSRAATAPNAQMRWPKGWRAKIIPAPPRAVSDKAEQREHAGVGEELSRPWTWGERRHRTLSFTASIFVWCDSAEVRLHSFRPSCARHAIGVGFRDERCDGPLGNRDNGSRPSRSSPWRPRTTTSVAPPSSPTLATINAGELAILVEPRRIIRVVRRLLAEIGGNASAQRL